MVESDTLGKENNIVVDKIRAREVIESALEARKNRDGLFANFIPPEKPFIDLLKKFGGELNDSRFCLNALFLTIPLVIAQNTSHFFNRIANPELLRQYGWIFNPDEVLGKGLKETDVIDVCNSYFRPAGYSANGLLQWMHNLKILGEKYNGDLRNFFRENDNDAEKVIDALVVRPRAKTDEKTGFRRYGPKLARLFVQWVNQYELYDLKNTDEIGIPADFQVSRILIQTDALLLNEPIQAHTITHKVVLPLISELCHENGFKPQEVSESLWTIGSYGCTNRRHEICPVASYCDSMISRTPYDRGGMFDPTDVGRFD